ncbi:7613_t:CDS:2 [Funneliformis geosporum]|nr:7613_t:CDS:2 [Funneliformis geosporum]
MSQKRKQKEEVVNYAKKHERNNAVTHFDLNKSMVKYWVLASEK